MQHFPIGAAVNIRHQSGRSRLEDHESIAVFVVVQHARAFVSMVFRPCKYTVGRFWKRVDILVRALSACAGHKKFHLAIAVVLHAVIVPIDIHRHLGGVHQWQNIVDQVLRASVLTDRVDGIMPDHNQPSGRAALKRGLDPLQLLSRSRDVLRSNGLFLAHLSVVPRSREHNCINMNNLECRGAVADFMQRCVPEIRKIPAMGHLRVCDLCGDVTAMIVVALDHQPRLLENRSRVNILERRLPLGIINGFYTLKQG